VYRYFRSKDDLIAAIVDRVLGQAADRFEALLQEGQAPEPAEAVATAVELVASVAERSPVDMTRVAVQAWAEALRNPEVAAVVGKAYTTMRSYFTEVARRGQEAGRLPEDADPGAVGSALFSLVLGFLLQRLLLGDVSPQTYVAGVRVLLPEPASATAAS
jgi:AcrR family transcriptional regulator